MTPTEQVVAALRDLLATEHWQSANLAGAREALVAYDTQPKQEPVAWRPQAKLLNVSVDSGRMWNNGKPTQDDIEHWAARNAGIEYAYAAPPAQPNPCAKIFEHKWLDPQCVEKGCQSLAPTAQPLSEAQERAAFDAWFLKSQHAAMGQDWLWAGWQARARGITGGKL